MNFGFIDYGDYMTNDKFIYGKNPLSKIVGFEPNDNSVDIFIRNSSKVETEVHPMKYWLVTHKPIFSDMIHLNGGNHFQYAKSFSNIDEYEENKKLCYFKRADFYTQSNLKRNAMIRHGYTYYKDLRPENLKVLAFDIETNGLFMNELSKVFIISNTIQFNNKLIQKQFTLDQYPNQIDMIKAWCAWVIEQNPDMILTHYGTNFDFPYLSTIMRNHAGHDLILGRDCSEIKYEAKVSQFAKDASQSYDYNNFHIYGREFIDTKFLAIKYDVARNLDSYSLKPMIKQLGLESPGRQYYDAKNIAKDWNDLKKREKIKKYAQDDSDDCIKLYNYMIPSYFYYAQHIPFSMQDIILSRTGAQVNSFLLRSYLQDGYSIPKADLKTPYQGAMVGSNPGIYHNTFKIDVASLYPSIILEKHLNNKTKDPFDYVYKMTEYFTIERLKNKKLAGETGDRYYKDMSDSQKIFINSVYGMLGAEGCNFNDMYLADMVTKTGREILQTAITWASGGIHAT